MNTRQNSEKTHHTVNFDDREQHRTSTLDDIQQRLTQISQKDNNTNIENIRPARPNKDPPNNRRWRNMAERHQHPNGQDSNSSTASDSGTSTDWDAGEPKNAQPADEKATTQEVVELKGTMNSGTLSATETTIVTTPAD